jgi:hypothetical protein
MTQTDSSLYNSSQVGQEFTIQDIETLAYQDCVVKSGIRPEIYHLNFEPASGIPAYDELFRDSDKTTNSGSSLEASRNLARCTGDAGYFYKNKFWLLSDLCGASKDAINGNIKSKGIFRPEGQPAAGWICSNGRFRQLAGAPIALDDKGQPRRYHQAKGKPLEVFCPKVTVAVWREIAAKHNLPMPEFPVVALGEALEFWDWVVATKCPVTITEGEKKACCLISRNIVAIGLPGINAGYRVTEYGEEITKPDGTTYRKAIARELCEVLQALDTAERVITILFDFRAGDYSQSKEFKAAGTTAKLFKSAIVKIAKLPGPDKGVDDFAVAGGDIDAVISEALPLTSEDWQFKKWLRLRGFSPDIKINSKYFDAPAPESGTVTAIKSGLGTGKTEYIKRKVASDSHGLQINLGYRNSLLLQQCEKWGSYHFDDHNGWQHVKDPDARLSLCIDSLLKLPLKMFEDSVEHVRGMTAILDECVSDIKHALQSKTLLGKRPEILDRLEIVCKLADRVVTSDGNNCDMVVDYIAEISGKRSVKIENIFTGDTPPIFFVDAGKKSKKWLSAEILKSRCPVVATDSLRDAEALAMQLEESHGKGLLLTSKTATKEEIKEFLKDPDAFIRKYGLAWIVYTPTAESGIDISIQNYFSDVFCWFVGVLGVDECMQMSRRVRHPERIIVLCPERGLKGKNSGGIFETEVIEALAEFRDTEARLLVQDESQLQKMREDLAAQIITPHTILWAKLQVKAELERAHLREYLLKAFELSGYTVQSVTAAECDYEGHAIAKNECKDIEAQEIFNAPDIELAEALEIKRNFKATWENRCRATKFFYKARLPGIEDSDLWNWEFIRRIQFDDRSLLAQLDNSWQFENPEDAEFLQRAKLSADRREFVGDFSTRWLKIKALRVLGLEKFMDPRKVWSQDSPEVLEIWERCKKKAIAKLLGHPGNMKPMQWLNYLLKLIGCKLIRKNVKRNGVQHREYSYAAESSRPANWDELAAFTAEKQAKKISEIKEAEALAAQELEAVAPPPVFDTNLGGDATLAPELSQQLELQPEPLPERAKPQEEAWGWFQRGKEWIKCRVLEFVEGRYVLQAKSMVDDGLVRFWAFPEDLRWEAPT